jgi:predicted O-methyltransferase YrrM
MTNLIKKTATWVECYRAIRRLPGDSSTAELVDFCMSQPLSPLQIRSELLSWAIEVAHIQPRNAMEIGTYRGGTLFLLCRLANSSARIISVDQHRGRLGGARKLIHYSFLKKGQRLHTIEADSHSQRTLSRISRHLGSEKLDFLFIDGDHSYNGVKSDFEMYSPLVQTGGLITFHDIVAHPPEAECHVKEFWDEVKQRYRHKEIIESPQQQWGGIGVLYV